MSFIHFETIDSTNTWLKQHWRENENMTFVSADYQSQGRGRQQRRWQSERGESLMFSLLVKDDVLLEKYQLISLVTACSLAEALEGMKISDVMIKWPNDVYVGGRKICGILLEGVSQPQLQCLIIGVDLNVNQKRFSGDYLHEPVSLYQLTGHISDVGKLRDQVYQLLIRNLEALKSGKDFSKTFQALDYLQGRRVRALIGNQSREVAVIGINADGSLKIKVDNEETDITSGEISFHV